MPPKSWTFAFSTVFKYEFLLAYNQVPGKLTDLVGK